MKKLIIILILITPLLKAPTLVHSNQNRTSQKIGYENSECPKQFSRLRLIIMRLFNYKLYLKCKQDGTIKVHSGNPFPSTVPSPSIFPISSSSPSPTPSATHAVSPRPSSSPSFQLGNPPSPYWHPPGAHDGLNVHEHGDNAPSWVTEFSKKNFGHPVLYGGDEATPNENVLKHQAYKGFTMHASGVDLFIRYHNMSNPHDRSGIFHSYEIYAKDNSGNISFWQGWEFVGDPQDRSQRATRRNEQPGHDEYNGINWPGRDQYIVSSPDLVDWKNYLRCEQWYKFGGEWAWDMSVTICGASTYYTVDEHLTDVANPATWKLTGDVGGSRRVEISHYGPANPLVTGVNLPEDKWYCVKKQPNYTFTGLHSRPTWDIGPTVAGPNDCPTGYLPQYFASTFPKKGVYFETGNTAEKDFPTDGVTIPN